MDRLSEIAINSWLVMGRMSPYLLLGFVIAGAMSVMVSAEWVGRHLGGRGFWPVVKATLLGVPLPLCSCGVIPVSAALRRQGASRGSTSAFLLATPETGVDSMLATYALLGPVFAVIRPVVALLGGVICGLLVDKLGEQGESESPADGSACGAAADCCASGSGSGGGSGGGRAARAVRYGLVTLPRDIAGHLLVGVAVAGLLMGLIEPGAMGRWLGGGFFSLVVMLAVGLPLYVCATGSIPVAVAFMHLGASPGAALVFLIAGPATNAATLTVTWKLLGRRSAVIYLLVAGGTALGAGLLLDLIWTPQSLLLPAEAHAHHDAAVTRFDHVAAAALAAVLLGSFWFTRPRNPRPRNSRPWKYSRSGKDEVAAWSEGCVTILNVRGMTCSHCAAAVEQALRAVPGVRSVQVDLAGQRATLDAPGVAAAALLAAIEAAGYQGASEQRAPGQRELEQPT